ncbi:hypothetical protein [Anditalea andensis]|uniref:Uncharacterized protein n=1 Tax=Anditalea andensis TaxID=1048983 RepID=A0A074L1Q0_9BACT|nr:hypothetical protein [Anditalea andensis]KEO73793.1 hypothetical protein EL17_09795 [Anditalea andensis]
MEKVIDNKSLSQYLSLVVKMISKDRLTTKEKESMDQLKNKVDPDGTLAKELMDSWSKAEAKCIQEASALTKASKSEKHPFINFLKKLRF